MPWPSWTHPGAPLHDEQTLHILQGSQPPAASAELWEAPVKNTGSRSSTTPAHHCHRRHYSSAADDYDVPRRVSSSPASSHAISSLSPPSPRWSIAESEEEEQEQEQQDRKEHDNQEQGANEGGDETMSDYSPGRAASYRHSTVSNISTTSTCTMSSTATTSTLRRYWSPSTPSSPVRVRSRPEQMPCSPPTYRTKRRSLSPTLTPGSSSSSSSSSSSFASSSASSVSPSSSAAMSATSTAPSTAPSTSPSSADGNRSRMAGALDQSSASTRPYTSGHIVTYIPPLVDGSGGTLSRWQRANQWQAEVSASTNTNFAARTFARPCINRIDRVSRILSNNKNDNDSRADTTDAHDAAFSPYRLLWSDICWLALAAPELLRLAWAKATTPVWAVAHPRVWSYILALPVNDVADAAEALVQAVLAVSEAAMLCAAPTLFLCLPGGLFVIWLLGCLAFLKMASWPLNGGANARTGTVYRGPWDMDMDMGSGDDDSDTSEDADEETDYDYEEKEGRRYRGNEKWFYVSGMGATSRSLAKTGPRIAGVFGRPITLIRPAYTYGAVADCLIALLQRLLLPFCVISVPGADTTVYAELRAALRTEHTGSSYNYRSSGASRRSNKNKDGRIVILAHNTGATAVAQALHRLAGDVSAARLAKVEVYTFGSLAPDFVLPQASSTTGACHVEHIALVHDPCARFGVLRSVRHDLAGRYCGGVFVVGGSSSSSSSSNINNNAFHATAAASATTTMAGIRPNSRTRSFSPSLAVAPVNHTKPSARNTVDKNDNNNNNSTNNKSNNRHYRLSFPLSYQQLQQHQHFLHGHHQRTTYRRSVSAASNHTSSIANTSATASPNVAAPAEQRKTVLSMEDYLTALFGPEPWSMRPDPNIVGDDGLLDMHDNSHNHLACDAYFVDAAVHVDRELAEKREMAALAAASAAAAAAYNREQSPHTTNHRRPSDDNRSSSLRLAKNAHHRLSWTGLGATAKYGTAVPSALSTSSTWMVGPGVKQPGKSTTQSSSKRATMQNNEAVSDSQLLLGLETARRICKEYEGRPGRDVSLLAGYFADAVARHRELFGF